MTPPLRRPRSAATLSLALGLDEEGNHADRPVPDALLGSAASRRSILTVMRALDRRAAQERQRQQAAADLAQELRGIGV